MSKIKKSELLSMIQEQSDSITKIWDVLDSLNADVLDNKKAIIKMENEREQSKLKQLDPSVFDGLDEKWRFAAVDKYGVGFKFESEPSVDSDGYVGGDWSYLGGSYDATNWKNSLIERDTAEELEVDLSSEMTGSELCKAMINRGDKIVLCIVKNYEHENDTYYDAITHCSGDYFESSLSTWSYAIPINNQGETLTAAEAGL